MVAGTYRSVKSVLINEWSVIKIIGPEELAKDVRMITSKRLSSLHVVALQLAQ